MSENKGREGAEGAPPAPHQEHFCSGCHRRWTGDVGAELCGDCWRKGQAVILTASPAPPSSIPRFGKMLDYIEQQHADWSGVEVIAFLRSELSAAPSPAPPSEAPTEVERWRTLYRAVAWMVNDYIGVCGLSMDFTQKHEQLGYAHEGYHNARAVMLTHMPPVPDGMAQGIRCKCFAKERGNSVPHSHYREPPYSCARCGCNAYVPTVPPVTEAALPLPRPETPMEIHLRDVYDALGVQWGDDPFAAISKLREAPSPIPRHQLSELAKKVLRRDRPMAFLLRRDRPMAFHGEAYRLAEELQKLAASPLPRWQDISTAPKDSRGVMVSDGRSVGVAEWCECADGHWIVFGATPDPIDTPTRWQPMPLPASPVPPPEEP